MPSNKCNSAPRAPLSDCWNSTARMDETLADILETCLVRIDAGDSLEACLAAYPQQRSALEAPLRVAALLRMLPRPALPAAIRAALITSILALAARRRAAHPTPSSAWARVAPSRWRGIEPGAILAGLLRALGYRGPLSLRWLRLASIAIALVLALVLGAGALAAVRAIVRIAQSPAPTPTLALPATPFTLDGPVEQLAPSSWVVNGISVAISAQTTVNGTPAPGSLAHVRGAMQGDGTLLAQVIIIDVPQPAPANQPVPTLPPSPVAAPTAPPPPAIEPHKPPKPKPSKHDDDKHEDGD
jgi:hypothetical protein